MSHLSESQAVAAGLHTLPGTASAFAATQAAWRFHHNPAITLPKLAQPLIDCAHHGVELCCDRYVLVALDWSLLHFGRHTSKAKRVTLAHDQDLGYELLTALAIGDRDGAPLAPLCLDLLAADGLHSTRSPRPIRAVSKLDRLAPVLEHVADLRLPKPVVAIIDREADSVGHYRRWHRKGHRFVIRADDARRVLHQGCERSLGAVAALKQTQTLKRARVVVFQGHLAEQFVGETTVVLHRPARTHRVDQRSGKARHKNIKGKPITLRLIVSEVRDEQGQVLGRWLLLSNLGTDVDAATIALWYYWRWRIESYHKLLKGAGQQVEHWQQETPEALARRLAVAAMACVVVWQLAWDPRPQAAELRQVLVRLSGRQMKRGKDQRGFTEPALLAGLGVLLPMLFLLEHHSVDDLRRLAQAALPNLLPLAAPAETG